MSKNSDLWKFHGDLNGDFLGLNEDVLRSLS